MYKNPNYKAEWREKNRERLRKQQNDYWNKNKTKLLKQRREFRRQTRIRVLQKLGGKCVRCGETDWRCLQIDHVYGGGEKERNELDCHQLYNKILGMSLSDALKTYQILCANHNMIKKYEKEEYPK